MLTRLLGPRRWAALLFNAGNPKSKTEVRTAFPAILKELSPVDAQPLDGAFDYLLHRTVGTEPKQIEFVQFLDGDSIAPPTSTVCLGNLLRLRFIKESPFADRRRVPARRRPSPRLPSASHRHIAAVSMIGLIAFAVLTFSATQAGEINWGAVAARAFVAATFGILAAYAARQSERYSEIEVGNRRYQLELSSIDPYLANLPADVQQTVKVELAQKLFGNASRAVGATSKKFSGTSKEPLELALGIILEFVKKRA